MHYLPVTLSALAAFFLGFVWYTVLFGKPWMQELGMDQERTKDGAPNMLPLLIGSFVLEICMAVSLSLLISPSDSWLDGLQIGFIVGLGVVATAMGVQYLYESKSLRFWCINAGYSLVVLMVMGMIIGAF